MKKTKHLKLCLTLSFAVFLSAHAVADNTVTDNVVAANQSTQTENDNIHANDELPNALLFPHLALVGSWSASIKDDNGNTTPALFSFLDGGVLLQTENPMVDPMLGNLVFSNAHGAWEYDTETNKYNIKYFKLVYQADAAFYGREESRGQLEMDKDGNLTGFVTLGKTGGKSTVIASKITASAE